MVYVAQVVSTIMVCCSTLIFGVMVPCWDIVSLKLIFYWIPYKLKRNHRRMVRIGINAVAVGTVISKVLNLIPVVIVIVIAFTVRKAYTYLAMLNCADNDANKSMNQISKELNSNTSVLNIVILGIEVFILLVQVLILVVKLILHIRQKRKEKVLHQ